MPKLYVPDNGQWKPVKEAYVGKDGTYVPQKVRLVAKEGRWRESYNNETDKPTNKVLEVKEVSYRGGNQMQGDLRLSGFGLDDIIPPDPKTGAFYTFRGNLNCYFDNFGKAVAHGSPLPLPSESDGIAGHALDASKKQYFTTPVGTASGYDFLALTGNLATWKHWEIGGKFKPTAFPDKTTDAIAVYHAGDTSGSISVMFDGSGSLYGVVAKKGSGTTKVEIANAVTLDKWTGFCLRHKADGKLELMLHDRRNKIVDMTTAYWTPAADIPIDIGRGYELSADKLADAFFTSTNTHPDFGIFDSGHTLYMDKAAYRSSQPSAIIQPNTGLYYLECYHPFSYNMHIGVAEPGMPLDNAPGVNGWCVDTIKGNKFDHQTGGGTRWSSPIPNDCTIGILYDSDAGSMRVFVNGVERPKPFPDGSITVPVQFVIGGTGYGGGVKEFNPKVNLDPSLWAHTPAGDIKPFSLQVIPGSGFTEVETFFTGFVSDFFIRSEPMINDDTIYHVINLNLRVKIKFENIDTGDVYDASDFVLTKKGDHLIMNVPEIPVGNYLLHAEQEGVETSSKRFFTVSKFEQNMEGLDLDFDKASIQEIRDGLVVAHKAWGGKNGGVVKENVNINKRTGMLELTSLGNLYKGPIKGVNRVGQPSGFNTRIGACVATKDYHGPGSYRVLCTFPKYEGVCSAFWTFHYEEGYPGSSLFNDHLADGLHISGKQEEGFYSVRNHEIDIEVPTALKTNRNQEDVSYKNARFNTWQGELRNWDVPNKDAPQFDPSYSPTNSPEYWSEYTDDFVNHGVELNDGELHEVRFDWHVGDDPRVDFYIDGVYKHTVRTHVPDIPGRFWIGLWFPSAKTHWAGRNANWVSQEMHVKRIQIIPFKDEIPNARQVTETYPWDVYRDFDNITYK